MQFVLMRHATRASSFDSDGALSPLGHAQAAGAVQQLLPHAQLATPTALFSSPKLRARQTLQPLGHHLKLEIKTDLRLDERSSHEPVAVFDSRIRSFLKEFARPTPGAVVLACSHMDWLEAVLPLLASNLSAAELTLPWAAGEFRIFEISEAGLWHPTGQGVLHPT